MEKHDLHHEFPEFDSKISELKVANTHFKKLTEEYDEVNHAVHRIESGVETTADQVLTELRKKRLLLKDELFGLLTQ
jgi:uncharacterized protein YdcH (DUF465 family)